MLLQVKIKKKCRFTRIYTFFCIYELQFSLFMIRSVSRQLQLGRLTLTTTFYREKFRRTPICWFIFNNMKPTLSIYLSADIVHSSFSVDLSVLTKAIGSEWNKTQLCTISFMYDCVGATYIHTMADQFPTDNINIETTILSILCHFSIYYKLKLLLQFF